MRLLILDLSSNKSFKSNSKVFGCNLWRITNRFFIGNVPRRVFEQMMKEVRRAASKSTSVAVFISDKREPSGWRLEIVGKGKINSALTPFLPEIDFKIPEVSKQIAEIMEKNKRRNHK